MKEKMNYESPQITVVELELEDVILSTSDVARSAMSASGFSETDVMF